MNTLEITAVDNFTKSGIKVFDPCGDGLHWLDIEVLFQHAYSYMLRLDKLSNIFSANRSLIEFIVIHRFDKDFKVLLEMKFPAVTTNHNNTVIYGTIDYTYETIHINKSFEKYSKKLRSFFKTGVLKPYYVIVRDDNSLNEVMTPMELFNLIAKYM